MHKTKLIAKITLAFSLFCTLSFAQAPKVAVYVSEQSGYSNDIKNALNAATVNVLVRSGRYEVVERSGVVDAELRRQYSGAVDDDQMIALGRQAGAKYVCVSDITELGRYHVPAQRDSQGKVIREGYNVHPHQVSARIIDVETAQLVGLGVIDQDIQSGAAMSAAIAGAVVKMLETMSDNVNPALTKRAIYVQGGGRRNHNANILYTYMLEALFTRSRYNGDFVVVERSEAFTRQIDREQIKQRSGAIADNEISRLGKQYGITEICIASIEPVMGTYNINARLVNVERASVVNASILRHMKDDNSKSGNLINLRNIAVQTVEDMIPRQLTKAEIEDEKRKQAEREKVARTAWMLGGTILTGGGISLDMDDIDPNYFKSIGYQWNLLNLEFYRQHLKFVRFGMSLNLGGVTKNKDVIKSEYPDIVYDSTESFVWGLNGFLRLYPIDYLFLSGGAGYGGFSMWSQNVSSERISVSKISTPIFPVGGGIFIGTKESGVAVEALYNIVPFKGRTAAYISINAGLKLNVRITEDKVYVREMI